MGEGGNLPVKASRCELAFDSEVLELVTFVYDVRRRKEASRQLQ